MPSLFTSALPVNEKIRADVDRLQLGFSHHGIDAYGIDKAELARFFTALEWAYRRYFDVHVYGAEHIPLSGRAMIIGNHSGGVALDALMVLASCFFELDPPRLAQGMAEKFINKVPGASQLASRLGQFTGLPEHADRLLRDDRLLMVFPEGARGTAKLARDADSLVRFGTGFMRLALKTGTPIVPVAFVGGGEAIPTVMNLYKLGQFLGVPYIPVTPYLFPLPKPVKLQLLYSEPLVFEGDGSEADEVIHGYVEQVRSRIAWLIEQARALRAGTLKPEELELPMKVLITGISGKLGRLVGKRLDSAGHSVLGVDRRPWAGAPERVQMFQVDIRKRPAEDVFRTEKPDAVIHMATVTHLTHKSPDRYRINLQGTRAIVENCNRYEVKQMLFVGRHTYYGAAADSPLYHTEDEPPMALNSFPELADLVAADLYAGSALWRYPEVNTCVLRLCYTLGGSKHGTLANFIRGPRVPTVLGFDPLFHFMHENDAADAIVAALDKNLRGVFNVSGPPPMLLSDVIRDAGRQNVPVPEALMNLTLGRFGLPRLPPGAVDHLKFPIVIDSAAFKKATGFQHAYEEAEALTAYRKSD